MLHKKQLFLVGFISRSGMRFCPLLNQFKNNYRALADAPGHSLAIPIAGFSSDRSSDSWGKRGKFRMKELSAYTAWQERMRKRPTVKKTVDAEQNVSTS